MLKSFTPAALALTLVAAMPAAGAAQENLIELARADLRTEAQAIVTAAMALPDSQAQKFWPVYREYERERALWNDRRAALIKRYAAQYTALTEDQAKSLAGDWFDLQQERLDLWEKYYKRVSKTLSPSVGARFVQVESQLNLVFDLQIAGELPLVFKRAGS